MNEGMRTADLIELHDGHHIPQLGVGTYKIDPGITERVVTEAFAAGVRHVDTAAYYNNETQVGHAIARSGVPREDIFVTTKLWNDRHGDPADALRESLDKLGLERVNLYLIHWPCPEQGRYLDAWEKLIELREAGLTDSIGVSNFEPDHLQRIIDATGQTPVVNQIELNPLRQRRELVADCRARGIAIEAWAPLGQGSHTLIDAPAVTAAAHAHRVSAAQVLIRWHLQHGNIIFPGSSNGQHLKDNANVFGFALSDKEMAALDALDGQAA